MRLDIRVIPRSSKNKIAVQPDGSVKVWLTAPPVAGAANNALIALLSKEYGVAKSRFRIVRGEKGKSKVVKISNFK